ncbi:MAG: hypothetical protein ACPH2K_00745 [Flavicella sp.]
MSFRKSTKNSAEISSNIVDFSNDTSLKAVLMDTDVSKVGMLAVLKTFLSLFQVSNVLFVKKIWLQIYAAIRFYFGITPNLLSEQ